MAEPKSASLYGHSISRGSSCYRAHVQLVGMQTDSWTWTGNKSCFWWTSIYERIRLNILFILLNIAYNIVLEINQFLLRKWVLKGLFEDHIELHEMFIILQVLKVSFEKQRSEVDKPKWPIFYHEDMSLSINVWSSLSKWCWDGVWSSSCLLTDHSPDMIKDPVLLLAFIHPFICCGCVD